MDEVNAGNYPALAARTEGTYEQARLAFERQEVVDALAVFTERACDIGSRLDVLKKHVFYGKEGLSLGIPGPVVYGPPLDDVWLAVQRVQVLRLLHASVGIATESAELLEHIRQVLYDGEPIDETNVIEELGDVLWYVAIALKALQQTQPELTLETIMARNIAKLRARYPEKFTSESAIHRNLAAERQALEGLPQTPGGAEIAQDAGERR